MISRFVFPTSYFTSRAASRTYFTYPVPRKLRDVVKMSLFERESPETIRSLWRDRFHRSDTVIVTAMKTSEFETMTNNSRRSPVFIIPVPTPSGFYNVFSQFQDSRQVLFTQLELFRTMQSRAPPFFVLTFFDELSVKKGVVLVRGDIVSHNLRKHEAEHILCQTKGFYIEADMYKWVETFNHRPRNFDFNEFKKKFQHLFKMT